MPPLPIRAPPAPLVFLVLAASAPPPRGAPAPPATAPQAHAPPSSPPVSPAVFELVETYPIETILDHPELRDATGVWLDMIAGARTSIDLAQFYASNHQPSSLERVIEALEAAV